MQKKLEELQKPLKNNIKFRSSPVDWLCIDPMSVNSKIYIRLGYPMDLSKLDNIDPRNYERILNLLQKDNKLK